MSLNSAETYRKMLSFLTNNGLDVGAHGNARVASISYASLEELNTVDLQHYETLLEATISISTDYMDKTAMLNELDFVQERLNHPRYAQIKAVPSLPTGGTPTSTENKPASAAVVTKKDKAGIAKPTTPKAPAVGAAPAPAVNAGAKTSAATRPNEYAHGDKHDKHDDHNQKNNDNHNNNTKHDDKKKGDFSSFAKGKERQKARQDARKLEKQNAESTSEGDSGGSSLGDYLNGGEESVSMPWQGGTTASYYEPDVDEELNIRLASLGFKIAGHSSDCDGDHPDHDDCVNSKGKVDERESDEDESDEKESDEKESDDKDESDKEESEDKDDK